MLLYELKKVGHSSSIASDDEVNVGEHSKDLRDYCQQEVNTFPVLQSGDENDVDLVRVAGLLDLFFPHLEVRSELLRVNCVGDSEGLGRIDLGS